MLATVILLAIASAITVAATAAPTISARLDTEPVSAQRAVDLLTESTVQLLALGCDLSNREGSGVIVGSGRLLTNAHVVAGTRLVDVSADGLPTIVATMATVAPVGDVAVVQAGGIAATGLTLAGADPQVGDQVRVAGFPSAPPGVRPPGLEIASAQVIGTLVGVGQPWPVLRLNVMVHPGMSGGPVLDQNGHLAGIVFGNEVPTGQALAIPASALREILDGRNLVATGCS